MANAVEMVTVQTKPSVVVSRRTIKVSVPGYSRAFRRHWSSSTKLRKKLRQASKYRHPRIEFLT